MPASNLYFRKTCGLFVAKRAKDKNSFVNCVRLVPTQGVITFQKSCVDFPISDSFFYMKHIVFKYDSSSSINTNRFGIATTCMIVFLTTYLLSCGDIEANPGPTGQNYRYDNQNMQRPQESYNQGWYSSGHADHTYLSRIQSEMSVTLNNAIEKIEAVNRRQGEEISQQLRNVENKIDRRLHQIEVQQQKTSHELERVQQQCQILTKENHYLKEDVNILRNETDYLDNQNRRHNLLFFGLTPERNVYESPEECERKVKSVIRDEMGIEENIAIEYAYKAGKAIIVRFLSLKDRILVISKARMLKDSATCKNVFVREDLSRSVQQKRRGLLPIQRNLRDKGIRAVFRFDKLISNDAIFTYDLFTEEVVESRRLHTTMIRSNEGQTQSNTGRRNSTGRLTAPTEVLSASPCSRRQADHPQQSIRISNAERKKQHEPTSSVATSTFRPRTPERDDMMYPSDTASQQQRSTGYNLRERATAGHDNNKQTKDSSDMGEYQQNKDRVNRKAAATKSTLANTIQDKQTARGFGRGRNRTPPCSQTRIDSMFQSAQMSHSLQDVRDHSPGLSDAGDDEVEVHDNNLDDVRYEDSIQSET